MVHTWIAEISALREEETYRKYYERVPDFRKQKADQLRFPQDRAQSVGAWMLLEKMREQYGAEPDRVFNLSHSGSYVLCSISTEKEAKVGCDIETIKETRMRVARRFFLPSETAYIERQPSGGAGRTIPTRRAIRTTSTITCKAPRNGRASACPGR